MKNTTPPRPRSKAVRVSVGIAYFICISVIVGWSLRDGAAASQAAVPPPKPAASGPDTTVAPEKTPGATGKARAGGDCAECGVVEAVRHIDTYIEIMEGCRRSENTGPLAPDYSLAGSQRNSVEPLKDIVATAAAGKRGAKRFAVTTRHQIVVRFRNGSRQVLNESTPRALHEGERVIIIAGLGTTGS